MNYHDIHTAFVYGPPEALHEWIDLRGEFPNLYEVRFVIPRDENHHRRYAEFIQLYEMVRKQDIDATYVDDISIDDPNGTALFTWLAGDDPIIQRAKDAGMTIVPFGQVAWE